MEISIPAIQLVDIKVTFQKSLATLEATGEIQKYENSTLDEELINLAYLSGSYSRFKIDPRLQNHEFEKLYTQWISSAFEKEQVLIAPHQAGMVTYAVKNEQGRIGLIAVSEKYQGKGWGKKLVKAAEYIAKQEGAKEMLIPTQQTNISACKLYQSLGYTPAQQVYVYHWWKGVSLQSQ